MGEPFSGVLTLIVRSWCQTRMYCRLELKVKPKGRVSSALSWAERLWFAVVVGRERAESVDDITAAQDRGAGGSIGGVIDQ